MFFRNLDYFIFNEIKPLQSVLLPFCCCDFWIIVGIGPCIINRERAGSRRPTKGNCVGENSQKCMESFQGQVTVYSLLGGPQLCTILTTTPTPPPIIVNFL